MFHISRLYLLAILAELQKRFVSLIEHLSILRLWRLFFNHIYSSIGTPQGAQCQCAPAFKGQFCESYVCQDYCLHGGSPTGHLESSGHYQCHCDCPPGTSGLRCEKDACSTLQCFHGGHCTILGGRELCNCTLNYSGLRCTEAIGELKKLQFSMVWEGSCT